MRILIASTVVPFIEGGGTFIVDWLVEKLRISGFETEVLKIPFLSRYAWMAEQMLAIRLMDIAQAADRLITIRTPSYLLNHPNKVVWFIHHHRDAYDLWGTEFQDLPNTSEGLAYRQMIINTDNQHLRNAKKIFTNSQIVSDRLKTFNSIDSEVLYPPLLNADQFTCHLYGDYIFYPSRIAKNKRQLLAVESMRYTQSAAKLLISGHAEDPTYIASIWSYIKEHKLENKITVIDRWISEHEKVDFIANACAGIYIPYDEDSYGYPTLECFHSHKAVITCNDSGGTSEIIEDGINGYICEPDPKAIAEKIDLLYTDRHKAKVMGNHGYDSIAKLQITWDHVIKSLTT